MLGDILIALSAVLAALLAGRLISDNSKLDLSHLAGGALGATLMALILNISLSGLDSIFDTSDSISELTEIQNSIVKRREMIVDIATLNGTGKTIENSPKSRLDALLSLEEVFPDYVRYHFARRREQARTDVISGVIRFCTSPSSRLDGDRPVSEKKIMPLSLKTFGTLLAIQPREIGESLLNRTVVNNANTTPSEQLREFAKVENCLTPFTGVRIGALPLSGAARLATALIEELTENLHLDYIDDTSAEEKEGSFAQIILQIDISAVPRTSFWHTIGSMVQRPLRFELGYQLANEAEKRLAAGRKQGSLVEMQTQLRLAKVYAAKCSALIAKEPAGGKLLAQMTRVIGYANQLMPAARDVERAEKMAEDRRSDEAATAAAKSLVNMYNECAGRTDSQCQYVNTPATKDAVALARTYLIMFGKPE